MVLRIKDIEIPVSEYVGLESHQDDILRSRAAQKLHISEDLIRSLRIHKKSLDARKKSRIVYHFQVDLDLHLDQNHLPDSSPIGKSFQTLLLSIPLKASHRGSFVIHLSSSALGLLGFLPHRYSLKGGNLASL